MTTRKTLPRRRAPARPRSRPAKPPAAEETTITGRTPRPPASESATAGNGALELATPEPGFAARVEGPEPERPLPTSRRAIFFDVENTSRAEHIGHVIDHLRVDRLGHRVDFVAVGNWRVIGHDTARLLARHGVNLVHSAPSVGVRDWSDLRIAVAAGVWLAGARPGDEIEIVSDDRAFDAVGDVAASLGIAYRRLSYRGLAGAPQDEVEEEREREVSAEPASRRGRRRGRHRGGAPHPSRTGPPAAHRPHAPHPPRPTAPHAAVPTTGGPAAAEPHTAPHDEIVSVVHELIGASPSRSTTLDTLANALKSRGFSRPPGSPRLITRLRHIKELEVNRAGVITLVGDGGRRAAETIAPPPEREGREREEREAAQPEPESVPTAGDEEPPVRAGAVEREEADVEEVADDIGNRLIDQKPVSPRAQPSRRRRTRRGGRRRRRRDQSAAPAG